MILHNFIIIRQAVTKSLNSIGHYRKVSLVRLVGMMLIVFVKKKHMEHVKNVATDTVGTGIMGKLVICLL
jgi:phosphatidylinositol-bisphosphatase